MSGYLLDTNVISEIVRITPHPRMGAFFIDHGDLWLSSIVIHELEYGVQAALGWQVTRGLGHRPRHRTPRGKVLSQLRTGTSAGT